jgi:hypothetical protein
VLDSVEPKGRGENHVRVLVWYRREGCVSISVAQWGGSAGEYQWKNNGRRISFEVRSC